MSNVGRKGIWVPPTALTNNQTKPSPIKHENPFERLTRNVRQQGFEVAARHDQAERVIEVRFTPTNDKTRQAVKVASGSSQATSLNVYVTYGVLDDPFYVTVSCIEKGLEELRQAL